MKNETIKISEIGDREVAFVSYVGNYMGNSKVFEDLFGKLCGWAGPKGLINSETVFLSAYRDDPHVTPADELRLEVCMNIPGGTETDGDIQNQILPGGKYAVMRTELDGPEEYGPAWMEVVEWLKGNGHEIDMTRPCYEIYLNNPNEHPKKHHILEICMSIK